MAEYCLVLSSDEASAAFGIAHSFIQAGGVKGFGSRRMNASANRYLRKVIRMLGGTNGPYGRARARHSTGRGASRKGSKAKARSKGTIAT